MREMLARSKTLPMLPAAALMLMIAPVMSGCVGSAGSATTETERTICRELRRDLPTYSTRDTEATKEDGARFLEIFGAVCS